MTILQGLACTALLLVLGRRIGRTFFPHEAHDVATLIGTLAGVAVFSLTGTLVYYSTSVTPITLGIAGIFASIGIVFGTRKTQRHEKRRQPHRNTKPLLLTMIVGIALGAWWTVILTNPITDAIRSPWLVIPPITVLAPALALIGSTILIKHNHRFGTIALCATLFSLFASAALLFPLGAGFDPFLHRATILHIAQYGTITPKPLYYIGEYALELYAYFFSGVPLFGVDVFLVPILAALVLTTAARRLSSPVIITLLALGNFLTTTPQSIGYLFAVMAIITLPEERPTFRQAYIPGLFALAAFAAHPIAGAPAIALIIYAYTRHRALKWIVAFGSAVALPAMFVLQAMLSHAAIRLTWQNLWRLDLLPLSGFFVSNGNTWLDSMYFVIGNLSIIVAALAILGAIAQSMQRSHRETSTGTIAATLIVSFILVALGIEFGYLIDYERQNFALRFLTLTSLFALPLAARGVTILQISLPTYTKHVTLSVFFIVCCAAVYGMYPRHDGYARSAAFNVSQADIDTVYAIHAKEAEDADYIVLSNQATAAAALQEFGFRKYYHGDIFYYPIPTGGVLYQSYLSIVNDGPTSKKIVEAMDTAGVETAYLVISDYWWKSDEVIENTKAFTDEWFAVDNGKTVVFAFTRDALLQ